ncbi:hypothetical protein BASA83_011650 [Batrachochytrium salamandrivorans]|nr:hypothetical protein BASA81_010333 [Batrachochytrium salamandrivorans]KAH9264824.1 hypothetical protein BASA83_011650 [Batrachochytrium salamandrivorans]
MKLAAATLFSLVAIATYASPAAYPENQVDVQHSATDAPVIVHLDKRAGDQPGFLQRVSGIQQSVNYNHHQPGHRGHQRHQGHQGYQGYQQGRQREMQQRLQNEHQRREQERQQQENQGLESYKKDVQKWKDNQLLGSDGYEHRNGVFFYPKHLVNGQRPNLVKPSDKVLAQLGTTNKHRNERKNSWRGMGDDKAPTRPEQGYDFYQDQGDLYRKLMQSDKGKIQHGERIRQLEEGRGTNTFDPILEDHIATAVGLHDPLEPVPKVVKNKSGLNAIFNKPPKPSKSILTKEYAGPKNERKVGFNKDVQLVTFERPEHKGPVRTDVPTEGSTDATGEQSDNQGPPQTDVPTEGSTDATGEQSDDQGPPQSEESTKSKQSGSKRFRDIIMGPDYITGQRLKNPTVFTIKKISINDPEDANNEQSENPTPSKGKKSTKGTKGKQPKSPTPSKGKKSTKGTKGKQPKSPTPPQTDVSTEDSTGERTQNPTLPQSKVSTQRSTGATPPQTKSPGSNWFKKIFGGKRPKGGSYQQFDNQDPPQRKVPTEDTTGVTPPQSKSSGFNWFKNLFGGKGSKGSSYQQFENQDPPQSEEISTQHTTGATSPQTKSSGSNWFKKIFGGKGSKGGSYQQFENQDSPQRKEISTQHTTGTNGEQSGNPTPPQGKVSTKSTTSKQHKNPTPLQSKVSTQISTDITYVRFGNQDPSQKGGSRPLSRFERVMQ